MTIFGISAGTSRTGVCVMQDGRLIAKHVHNYPTPWSDTKLRIILGRYRQYFRRYPITDVVIKVPTSSSQTPALRRLVRRIEALAKENLCEFDHTTKIEIKGTYSLKSTEEIIKFAVQMHPELKPLYEKYRGSDHAFHRKLFEAVMAAHVYENRKASRKE